MLTNYFNLIEVIMKLLYTDIPYNITEILAEEAQIAAKAGKRVFYIAPNSLSFEKERAVLAPTVLAVSLMQKDASRQLYQLREQDHRVVEECSSVFGAAVE